MHEKRGKKKNWYIVALLLAVILLLVGCGNDGEWPEETASLATLVKEAKIIPSDKAAPNYPDTKDTVYRMFFDNTNSMRGFVKPTMDNHIKTEFVYAIDGALDEAYRMRDAKKNGFRDMEGYILTADANNILRWKNIQLNGLQGDLCSDNFYTGSGGERTGTLKENGESVGPLSRLFQKGNIAGAEDSETPFLKDGLTVIVSDLMEQGFELDVLYRGVKDYYAVNPAAAVALIGCTSSYKGNMSIPMHSENGTSETTVYGYDGKASFYFFIVGPVNLVEEYVGNLEERLSTDKVPHDTVIFRNCQSPQTQTEALTFEAVPDTMEKIKKLKYYDDDASRILGSANTTEVMDVDGNIILADIDDVTSDAMGDTFQLSAMADVQPGVEYKLGEAQIYALTYEESKEGDVLTNQWTRCNGNEKNSVTLRGEVMEGEKVDLDRDGDPIIVVAKGRSVYYVRCTLELKDGAIEDEAGVYAVVVPYVGTRQGRSQEESLQALQERSVSINGFDTALKGLRNQSDGYLWDSSAVGTEAEKALQGTLTLSNLLNSLNNSAFEDQQDANYLTFIFDLSDR